jgi:hypothetical protein
MNRFGRNLVLAQTALSLVFMTWAVMVYLQFNDYGWKEPKKIWETKDSGYRIASQLDKRVAALHTLYRQKERALPGVQPALDKLTETMEHFPKNHQFYLEELARVRQGEGEIQPKQLTWKEGVLVVDTPDKPLGKPVMKTPVGGIDKSTKTLTTERDNIYAQIDAITPMIQNLVKNVDEITLQLYGTKDDKGKSVDIGLYEVLENETTHQDKIRQEIEDITPRYVDAERRAAGFRNRYRGMEQTISRIRE